MPYSSGTFSRIYNWSVEQASAPIEIAKLDTQEDDVATALSTCLLRDGTGLPTANLDWNGKKITNLANASASTDALNMATGDTRYFSISSSASIATDRLVGRDTAGTGAVEAITVGGGLEFTGSAGIQIANDGVTNARLANMTSATVKGQTSGGSGDPVDLTAAQLVTIINTADGSGSGLDADLLDGLNAANTATASTIAARDASGHLWAVNFNSGAANDTSGPYASLVYNNGIDGYYRKSTAAAIISNLGIWTSGNDGTGSGLDADLLDGLNSTAFALASHTHTKSQITDLETLASGTYTPTIGGTSGSSSISGQYMRVGNIVTVSGGFLNSTGGASNFTISLPISSDLTQAYDCAGTISCGQSQSRGIQADATNNVAQQVATFSSISATSTQFTFEFTYRVQ